MPDTPYAISILQSGGAPEVKRVSDNSPLPVVVTDMPAIDVELPEGAATEETLASLEEKVATEETLAAIETALAGAATEETLSELNGKIEVSDSVGGIKSAYTGADLTGLIEASVASADLTTPVTMIAANAEAYYRIYDLIILVPNDAITVRVKVGSTLAWIFTGPGESGRPPLYGVAPSKTGNEAVTIEADGEGEVVAHVFARSETLPPP